MTAGRGIARRSLFTTVPSASTISALRSMTSRSARRTGTMVSGSNEAFRARQRKESPSDKAAVPPGVSETATYATQQAKARQELALSPFTPALGERATKDRKLLRHGAPGRTPRRGTTFHRILPRSKLGECGAERRVNSNRQGMGHPVQRYSRALGLANQSPDQPVTLAKWNAGLHQEVGEVRGTQRRVEGGAHPALVGGHRRDGSGHRGEHERERVERVEQERLVLLEILAVTGGEALQRRQERDQITQEPS